MGGVPPRTFFMSGERADFYKRTIHVYDNLANVVYVWKKDGTNIFAHIWGQQGVIFEWKCIFSDLGENCFVNKSSHNDLTSWAQNDCFSNELSMNVVSYLQTSNIGDLSRTFAAVKTG